MKKLAILTAYSFITFFVNAQIVVIQVNEVQSFFGGREWSMDSVLNSPNYSTPTLPKNCRYELNFNDSTLKFYRDGEFIIEGAIQIQTQSGVRIVKILEDGFDFGLILDLRIENESVIYYQIYSNDIEDEIEYMQFTNFQIIRSS